MQEDGELAEIIHVVEESPSKSVFVMRAEDLLILATTSGGIGIILSGVGVFLSQFAEMIPFEWMYEEISGFIKFGLLIVAIAVLLGFVFVWEICRNDIPGVLRFCRNA